MTPYLHPEKFFNYGGALPADDPSYIARTADETVLSAVRHGKFCWVTAPHHLGKSSLATHTVATLRTENIQPVTVSFAGSGGDVAADQLYMLVLRRCKADLHLAEDVNGWWAAHSDILPPQRLVAFFRELVLAHTEKPVALFVDRLDADLNRRFVDGLFAAIASIYAARNVDPLWERVTVVLLGRAIPEDFGLDTAMPLLVDGERVALQEFSVEELEYFRTGMPDASDEQWKVVRDSVFLWTQGHPYLTQRMLAEISRMWDNRWTAERVTDLVDSLFLPSEMALEPDLQFIFEALENFPQRKSLLKLSEKVWGGAEIVFNSADACHRELVATGLAAVRNERLDVRNPVYRLVFNRQWRKSYTPTNWRFITAVAIIFVCLIAGLIYSVNFRKQKETAAKAKTLIAGVKNAANADERLVNLAALLKFEDYRTEARHLALEELPRDELLVMLSPANPVAVDDALVTTIRGLYTAPSARTGDTDRLLKAMQQPLSSLEHKTSLGAVELNLEIGQWLRGRALYRDEQQYQRAVDAYNIALTVNSRNAGVYFDRALAYAALGQVEDALKDFKRAQTLDAEWQPDVQQALLDDATLYATLWDNPQSYADFLALAPSPTVTATPTATPSPTDTATPTPTLLPPSNTLTVTPSPTATASPTATPHPPTATPRRISSTATPTSGVTGGVFRLLNPISTDSPTHGDTEFRWRWTGNLPAGYGFEIRVWANGEPPLGAHDAIRDNQTGTVQHVGGDEYQLLTNIKDAAGVRQRNGEYNWAVALIQYQPTYKDLGIASSPALLRFEVASSGGGGGNSDGGNNSGGGVGIE